MEKTIEDYKNLVELLKQALLFYANDENYASPKGGGFTMMTIDGGSQARFALTKITEFTESGEKLEADYMKNMHEAIQGEESPENILKIIEGFKNIAKND